MRIGYLQACRKLIETSLHEGRNTLPFEELNLVLVALITDDTTVTIDLHTIFQIARTEPAGYLFVRPNDGSLWWKMEFNTVSESSNNAVADQHERPLPYALHELSTHLIGTQDCGLSLGPVQDLEWGLPHRKGLLED